MTILEVISIANVIILFITVVVAGIYAWLTYGIRETSIQQLKHSLMPFPIVYLKGRDLKGHLNTIFLVKNIGNGTALNIQIEDFNLHIKDNIDGTKIDEKYKMTLKMKNPNILEKGGESELITETFLNNKSMGPGYSLSPYLDPRFSNMEIPLTLNYLDITGRKYSTKISFGTGKLNIIEPPREEKLKKASQLSSEPP